MNSMLRGATQGTEAILKADPSSDSRTGAGQASLPLRDTARCRLCSRSGADERCFVKYQGEDQPVCRACWEQLILDPRRVIASLARAAIQMGSFLPGAPSHDAPENRPPTPSGYRCPGANPA